jgi:hypothetical protein
LVALLAWLVAGLPVAAQDQAATDIAAFEKALAGAKRDYVACRKASYRLERVVLVSEGGSTARNCTEILARAPEATVGFERRTIKAEVFKALARYRTVATALLTRRLRQKPVGRQRVVAAHAAYVSAQQRVAIQNANYTGYLRRDHRIGLSDEKVRLAREGYRARVRLEYMSASVAASVLAAQMPVVTEKSQRDQALRLSIPAGIGDSAPMPSLPVSVLVLHLGHLATDIASYDLNRRSQPQDARLVPVILGWKVEAAYEEYAYLAQSGLIVDAQTSRPFKGFLRNEVAKRVQQNLVDYLKWVVARNEPRSESLLGGWYRKTFHPDSRKAFAERVQAQLDASFESRVMSYLDSGMEPAPNVYYRAVANALNAERNVVLARFRHYLGEGFWNTGLGQLMRANNVLDPGNNLDDVRGRLTRLENDFDHLVKVFNAAAKAENPAALKESHPKYFKLLKDYGYILSYKDRSGTEKFSFHVPHSRHGLGATVRDAKAAADVPGAHLLDVISPKNIGVTTASIILPELAAGWVASAAQSSTVLSEGGLMALRVFTEAATGIAVDATVDYLEHDGKIDYEKFVLESVVLGGLLQVTGGATSKFIEKHLNPNATKAFQDAASDAFEKFSRQQAGQLDKFYEYLGEALGMGAEVAVTATFQALVEQQQLDSNYLGSLLLNTVLSRTISKNYGNTKEAARRFLDDPARQPEWLKGLLKVGPPELKQEMAEAIGAKLEEVQANLERYHEVIKESDDPDVRVMKTVQLLRGSDLSWTEMKELFGVAQETVNPIMSGVSDWRREHFVNMVHEARRRALDEIGENRTRQLRELSEQISDPAELLKAKEEVIERWSAEIASALQDPHTPGSKTPISDIDRSSPSAYLRKNLVALYDIYARQEAGDGIATSARAFDVNEYINVFPAITRNAEFSADLRTQTMRGNDPQLAAVRENIVKWRPGGQAGESTVLPDIAHGFTLPHGDAMEAISLAKRFRDAASEKQIEQIIANERKVLKRDIKAGRRTADDAAALENIIKFAKTSLADAEAKLSKLRDRIAREKGRDVSDPEVEWLAREELYNTRMHEIADLQYELSVIERRGERTPEALNLRAEIERRMNIAMRDGIETYSYSSGIHLVVTLAQSVEGMTVTKRIADPDFTISGRALRGKVSKQDLRGMLNDQLAFIAEHIHAYTAGHEVAYLTGRAIGKYVERAFLALTVGEHLSHAELMQRKPDDPARRLLEIAQKLTDDDVKNDPKKIMKILLAEAPGGNPDVNGGLAQIFFLIEQVFPRMQGMSGVARIYDGNVLGPKWTNPYARGPRATAIAREIKFIREIGETLGHHAAVKYVNAEIAVVEREIEHVISEISRLKSLGRRYRLVDMDRVVKLTKQANTLRRYQDGMPWQRAHSRAYADADREIADIEGAISQLEQNPRSGDIHEILMGDGGSAEYRRMVNRQKWLSYRLFILRENRPTFEARIERQYDAMDLTGPWTCDAGYSAQAKGVAANAGPGKLTLKLTFPKLGGNGPHYVMEANRRGDRLRGMVIDMNAKSKAFYPEGQEAQTRSLFEAILTRDGAELRTTYVSQMPGSKIRLELLECTRRVTPPPSAQVTFLSHEFAANTGMEAELRPGRGLLFVPVMEETIALAGRLVVKVRGRPVPLRGWSQSLPPGRYEIGYRTAGKSFKDTIEIAEGKVTKLSINPGYLVIKERTKSGRVITSQRAIIHEGSKLPATDTALPSDKTKIPLAPGSYELRLGSGPWQKDRPALVSQIKIEPGGTVQFDVVWSELQVAMSGTGVGSDMIGLRARTTVEKKDKWMPLNVLGGWANGSTLHVPLPAGDYELTDLSASGGRSVPVKIENESIARVAFP